MSARKRIYAALAANGFGQVVTVGAQLLLTPIFFRLWGAERYGEWLILSAIPAYLTLVDLGVSSAASNEMAIRAGARDFFGAQRTFRGAKLVVWIAAASALLLGIVAAALNTWLQWLHLAYISHTEASVVLLLLSAQVGLSFFGGLVHSGFRCAGFNALGTTLGNLGRLGEAVGSAAVLLWGLGPLALCAVTFGVRATFLCWQWGALRHSCSWLFSPRAPADTHLMRRLLMPSIAFMAFPAGYALALQGPILIIAGLFGSGAVAVFSAMRTLARLPTQFTNVLNNSVAPELSRAHGEGCLERVRLLHRTAWVATAGLGLVACVALALAGPWLTELWLGPGRHDQGVLLALLAVSWASAVWNVSSIVFTSTNHHVRLSIVFLIVNILGLGLAAALGRLFGMTGLLIALFLTELTILVWLVPAALARTGDNLRSFSLALRCHR